MPKKLLLPIILLFAVGAAFWQHQYIFDQIKLYGYEPASSISELATETTMTDGARRVFYVNHPELKDRSTFAKFCSTGTEQTVVLGCYKAPQQGIYLLQVSNAELEGIEQVTAAHELLHAEYDRLSGRERTRIDGLLQTYYESQLKDETVKKTIDGYRKTEPNDLINEMHSILGTQIGDLPAELEEHYAQYFSDRSKIVSYYQKYEQAFTSRQNQIRTFDEQLTQQKQTISSLEATVTQQGESLRMQRARLDQLSSSNNVGAYNAGVDAYNAAASTYNANIRRLRSLVDAYNVAVEQRNAIAFEEQALVKEISAPEVTTQ